MIATILGAISVMLAWPTTSLAITETFDEETGVLEVTIGWNKSPTLVDGSRRANGGLHYSHSGLFRACEECEWRQWSDIQTLRYINHDRWGVAWGAPMPIDAWLRDGSDSVQIDIVNHRRDAARRSQFSVSYPRHNPTPRRVIMRGLTVDANGNGRWDIRFNRREISGYGIRTGAGNDLVDWRRSRIAPVNTFSVIATFAGNDTVYGSNGTETIHAGPGNDRVTGRGGRDNIYGGSGNNLLHAGWGRSNTIFGGPGNDRMVGGPGNDVFYPRAGRNRVAMRGGNNIVVGSRGGRDIYYGGPGYNRALMAHGRAIFYGGRGSSRVYTPITRAWRFINCGRRGGQLTQRHPRTRNCHRVLYPNRRPR